MDLIEQILVGIVGGEQPWWIYAALVLIPICMLVTARELVCWFFKINKLVNRLEKIERQLLHKNVLAQSSTSVPKSGETLKVPGDMHKMNDKKANDDPPTLERDLKVSTHKELDEDYKL